MNNENFKFNLKKITKPIGKGASSVVDATKKTGAGVSKMINKTPIGRLQKSTVGMMTKTMDGFGNMMSSSWGWVFMFIVALIIMGLFFKFYF